MSKPDNLQALGNTKFLGISRNEAYSHTEWEVGTASPERAELTELMELRGLALPLSRTVQKGPFDGIDGIDASAPSLRKNCPERPV